MWNEEGSYVNYEFQVFVKISSDQERQILTTIPY